MRPSRVMRRRAGAIALAVAAVVLVWLLLRGGGAPEPTDDAEQEPSTTTTGSGRADPGGAASAEELVDSVLLIGFEGTKPSAVVAEVEDHRLGGVLIGAGNWEGSGPGRKLVDAIRSASERAPLIVTRQEGGRYRALADLPPSRREIEIGERADPRLAERWAAGGAQALRDVGVDLNLAPVADVATLDSPIADRAFSDDPAVATEMTVAALRGCEDAGLACAVSHFPGLGAGTQDTDQGPSSIGLDAGTLGSRDLAPFVAAFDAGAPAVVVSHGLYAAYDPVTPASLSIALTTGLLRDELGFAGVAISDDIGAGAIGAFSEPGEAAVAALDAGIDLVQVADPADVEAVRRAMLAAIEVGTLSEERLQQAAARIAAMRREIAASSGAEGTGGR